MFTLQEMNDCSNQFRNSHDHGGSPGVKEQLHKDPRQADSLEKAVCINTEQQEYTLLLHQLPLEEQHPARQQPAHDLMVAVVCPECC